MQQQAEYKNGTKVANQKMTADTFLQLTKANIEKKTTTLLRIVNQYDYNL